MNQEASIEDLTTGLLVGVPVYILIDPLAGDPMFVQADETIDASILNDLRADAWDAEVFPIELDEQIALSPYNHPYLVLLNYENQDALLAESLILAQSELAGTHIGGLAGDGSAPHSIGGWIQTTMPVEQLATQLSNMMLVQVQAQTKFRYQRLGDRRVLDWFGEIVGQERLSSMLGNIQRWLYIDMHGDIKQLRKTQEAATMPRLSSAEWNRFMLGAQLHQTIARWISEYRSLQENTPMHQHADASTWGLNNTQALSPKHNTYQRAAQALAQVKSVKGRWRARFQTTEDEVTWAVLHLLYGDIEQQEAVVAMLNVPEDAENVASLNSIYMEINTQLQRTTS